MLDWIGKHAKYLSYVFSHKWYVFLEACKLGIPWQGLLHDLSKLTFKEWIPRAEALYQRRPMFDSEGFFDPGKISNELSLCWLSHQHANPHHWQWWVMLLDSGKYKPLPMTDKYRREMLADWLAVSRSPQRMDMIPWYLKHRDRMILHPETRAWIEEKLGVTSLRFSEQAGGGSGFRQDEQAPELKAQSK